MTQHLRAARQRAYELMRDGREDVLLREFDAHPGWASDAYLLRLRGDAFWLADRLNEAEASYRAVLELPGADNEKRLARRELTRLEEEWQLVARGRGALARARWAMGGTLVVLTAGLAWLYVRRRRLGG